LILAPLDVHYGLAFPSQWLENGRMKIFHGRVHNGVVVLEDGPVLPEGAAVIVSRAEAEGATKPAEQKRVKFPLVHSNNPGSLHLTNERIAEVLDEEDASPRH
jgi:hypothetical protein